MDKAPKKRIFALSARSIILLASLALNFHLLTKMTEKPLDIITFPNANLRDTYFTAHNVKAAHKISTGKGIKVGIMDWHFGYAAHPNLYAGTVNFSQYKNGLDPEEHGLWMANALKEIAPDCEVYALCTYSILEGRKVDNMVKAIDWAIENNIDVLTYSNMAFLFKKNRAKIDEAVNKAVKHGIVTTFIHYDNPNNLFPNGFFGSIDNNNKGRKVDVNILHYDYNTLFQNRYEGYKKNRGHSIIREIIGGNVPYLSASSTSPVLAGFVAILKSINPDLSPADYKYILIKTSYQTEYDDWGFRRKWNIPRAVDIGKAAAYTHSNKSP